MVYGQVGKGITLIVISVLLAVTVVGYLALMVATTIDAYKIGTVTAIMAFLADSKKRAQMPGALTRPAPWIIIIAIARSAVSIEAL